MLNPFARNITVDVNMSDIERGIATECLFCPLAVALRRYFPNVRAEVTTNEVIILVDADTVYYYDLDAAGRELVSQFDDYQKVKPTTVKLTFRSQEPLCADSVYREMGYDEWQDQLAELQERLWEGTF